MSPSAEEPTKESNRNKTDSPPVIEDKLVVTHHKISIGGQAISYTATCGTIVLKEETERSGDQAGKSEGEVAKATIFFVAYTKDGISDTSKRPLTFSFNGGPGSSSVWLHLGLLGPRRVLMDETGNSLPPPYRLVENEFSLLDESDLVFIDPVSTGFSRVAPGEKATEFHGFKKDIESVGDFIRLYTSRFRRWDSPKFLVGESYGTTRSAGLAGYLQERHGLYLNGIMLISSVLNFQTLEFETGNDFPYLLFLPTYTATAWYHRRLPEDLQANLRAALDEAEAFAYGEYNQALMKGSALPPGERTRIAELVARYTGLAIDYIERADLRVEIYRFIKELLRSEGEMVGRLDSRFKGYDRDAAGEHPEYDPSYSNILGPYSGMLNQYLMRDLEFETDLPYEILNLKVWPWNYSDHQNRYVDVAETLRKAMTMNPFLKVFVANGYYDLATPYFATRYTFDHLGLPSALQKNISMAYYEAGHMMYIHMPSLAQLKNDLANFVQQASNLVE